MIFFHFFKIILVFVLFNYTLAEEIRIRADIVKADTRRKISTFQGNVVMNIKDGIIKSDAAEYLESEKKIIFSGRINVKHGVRKETKISSGKAVYLVDTEVLSFSGEPLLTYLLESTTVTIRITAEEMKFDLKNNIFYFYNNINATTEDISIFGDEGVYYLNKGSIELNKRHAQIKIIYENRGEALADNVIFDINSRFFIFKGNVNMSYRL